MAAARPAPLRSSKETRLLAVAIMLATLADAHAAQNCEAIPAGPDRTDCYIAASRLSQGQSDVATGKARVQSSAARFRQVTGKAPQQRRKRSTIVNPE